MTFDLVSIFAYVFGLFLLYLCCWLFIKPLKWLFGLMVSCLIGAALVWVINFLTGFANIHIAINPLTAMITGVLGAPGIALIYIIQTIL